MSQPGMDFKWTPAPHIVIQTVTGGLAHRGEGVQVPDLLRAERPVLPALPTCWHRRLFRRCLQALECPGPEALGSLRSSSVPCQRGPGASPSLRKNLLSLMCSWVSLWPRPRARWPDPPIPAAVGSDWWVSASFWFQILDHTCLAAWLLAGPQRH